MMNSMERVTSEPNPVIDFRTARDRKLNRNGNSADPSSFFQLGRNTWRKERASRASFLVDADAFYTAFVEAALKAQHSIFIVGWDTDSRTELPIPLGISLENTNLTPNANGRVELGPFLAALTRARPELRVFVLTWDFAFIYLFERETWPSLKFGSLDPDRLRFVLDREHPALASHHQKIVVIDDHVGFSGGLDLTQRRWDTSEHRCEDKRRIDPGGQLYEPFHDVQMCVEGEAAHALGDIVRERWRIATGDELPNRSNQTSDVWPACATAHLRDVDVAVARTLPAGYLTQKSSADLSQSARLSVNEVETLFVDSIRKAKRFLYIENQYFTCPKIAREIAARLREPDGPEVVLVLPRDQTGWIEESTMGLLRATAIKIAREGDEHNRFRCFYPVVPGLQTGYVKVHSKLMIIDDEFVRVGSANLNSRSMGLDTECDLAVEAAGRSDVSAAIRDLRECLVCEHLGVSRDEFRRAETSSFVATVDALVGGPRTLVPMEATIPEWIEQISPPREWIDPSAPKGIRRWFARRIRRHPIAWASTIGLLVIAISIGFIEFGLGVPLTKAPVAFAQWFRSIDPEKIAAWIEVAKGGQWTIPTVILGAAFLSILFVPITILILGIALSFSPVTALMIAGFASILGAVLGYGLGRYWAFSKSRILSMPWVQRASQKLAQGGVWTVVAVRLAPIAPFTAVNIVAGGLRLPFQQFVLGTILGLAPGVLAITFLSQSAGRLVQAGNWMILASVVAAAGVVWSIRQWGPRWKKV